MLLRELLNEGLESKVIGSLEKDGYTNGVDFTFDSGSLWLSSDAGKDIIDLLMDKRVKFTSKKNSHPKDKSFVYEIELEWWPNSAN